MKTEKQYHINLSQRDASKYAIICGAPERVSQIASKLEQPHLITTNREFLTYSGYLNDERLLVTSTGIGGPSAAIAVEELSRIGVNTIIRVGTCGGIQLDVKPGELIIASAAVRMDGTTKEYAPIEFPATANYELTTALKESCDEFAFKYHIGTIQSKDSFYGQHDPNNTAVSQTLLKKWDAWKRCGVLASEMECSTLFIVSSIRKIRAGAVLQTIWNQERADAGISDNDEFNTDNAVVAAVEAMKRIIAVDKLKNDI